MKKLLFVFLVLATQICYADYVEITRNAYIYEEASKSSQLVKKSNIGEFYELVSTKQSNGYFHIKIPNTTRTGWVYRTLVRRYEGSLPNAQPTDDKGDVVVRVIDVGAGLCTVIKLPNGEYIIYDAGHYRGVGNTSYNQIREFLPEEAEIQLMILSHTDGDHIGAAGHLIKNHKVRKLLWTGYEKSMVYAPEPTSSYDRIVNALSKIDYNMDDINLNERDSIITSGTTLSYGDVKLTFLCGFGEPMADWDVKTNSERLNGVSIVMKLEYQGKSILFCGDAVGRHIGDPVDALIATEKYMVNNAKQWLNSDIIIAPHHGADNGSSTAFVDLVKPESVIFSSGHEYNHPTKGAVDRYLKYVDVNNIYRTDRGDDERKDGKPYYEWSYGRIDGCHDGYGDDDLEIVLKGNGEYRIGYLQPNPPCEH